MKKIFSFLLLIFSTLFVAPVLAISSPGLISPENQSTIETNPSLKWQSVEGATQYRVIVDDEPEIKSPYLKNYYTTNTTYSPQMDSGTYFWKVAAKDSGGAWSEYSPIFTFNLNKDNGTSNTETTPTTTSTPTPTTTTQPSSFTISNTPTQINSNQEFSTEVNLSLPNNPSSKFYLKGAFKKSDSTNYFGLTKSGSSFVANGQSYSSQISINTDSNGSWKGSVTVKVDIEDSGFTGTGDYLFKIGRYTSSGSGPTWSNEVTVKINSINNPTLSPTPTSKTSSNPTSTTAVKGVTKKASSHSSPSANFKTSSNSAIKNYYTPTPTEKPIEVKGTQKNYLPFVGGTFVVLGILSLIYIFITASRAKFTS